MGANSNHVKEIAVEIIRDYLGEQVAIQYKTFYDSQDYKNVLLSIHELLTEYLGESRAQNILIGKGLEEVIS